jgi:DNA invertase Pin-like site-specific DNA recombinase
LHLDESFRDEGISAFKGKHRAAGALKRFVDRVESGEVASGAVLLVESLDRLSREEVLDALEFFLRLMRLGLTVVTIGDGERVYSRESLRGDHSQLMMSLFVMARAHEESATKSDRVGRAWAVKRERARETKQAMTARCPAWIRLVGGPKTGRFELIEDRAAVVRDVFAKTIAGVGRRTIARGLNAEAVPAWGGGNAWHGSYVQKIVSNPAAYEPSRRWGSLRAAPTKRRRLSRAISRRSSTRRRSADRCRTDDLSKPRREGGSGDAAQLRQFADSPIVCYATSPSYKRTAKSPGAEVGRALTLRNCCVAQKSVTEFNCARRTCAGLQRGGNAHENI